MKNYHFSPNERGDTIVEVLICIAILAVIISGAYVTSNNSLTSERDSQEHAEALTLAQGQLEAIESLSIQGNPLVFKPQYRCVEVNGASIMPVTGNHCYVPSNNLNAIPSTTQNANPVPAYYYDIDLAVPNPNQYITLPNDTQIPITTYDVTVTWDSLKGGTDSVELSYRPN